MNLVFLHGNGGGGHRFSRLKPWVPQGVGFLAPTLPGFGCRPLPSGWGLDQLADHLIEVVDPLPRPTVLLAHGIGGSLALQALQQRTDWVDGVIFHAPVGAALRHRLFPKLMRLPGMCEVGRWCFSTPLLRGFWTRALFHHEPPPDFLKTFFLDYQDCEAFGLMFRELTADWFEALEPVDLPSILLWGDRERVLGSTQADEFRPLLPQARLRLIYGWDHFPMVEQPRDYLEEVLRLARQLV